MKIFLQQPSNWQLCFNKLTRNKWKLIPQTQIVFQFTEKFKMWEAEWAPECFCVKLISKACSSLWDKFSPWKSENSHKHHSWRENCCPCKNEAKTFSIQQLKIHVEIERKIFPRFFDFACAKRNFHQGKLFWFGEPSPELYLDLMNYSSDLSQNKLCVIRICGCDLWVMSPPVAWATIQAFNSRLEWHVWRHFSKQK